MLLFDNLFISPPLFSLRTMITYHFLILTFMYRIPVRDWLLFRLSYLLSHSLCSILFM
ncbi:hypothetical protein BDZ91DRAFT_711465 [Kalaharituber pfeilii]|nr:hypothetical protein BDZ91DRAFT_711465 [Kalaharituber pfeilii]